MGGRRKGGWGIAGEEEGERETMRR